MNKKQSCEQKEEITLKAKNTPSLLL